MKKVILFVSIIGLFALASCGDKKPEIESTNSNSTIDISSQNETSDSPNTNPLTSDGETFKTSESSDNNTSSNDETEKDDDVYDDGIDWGPLH